MKKFLCSLLAILMLAGLCGCAGSNDDADIRGEIITGDSSSVEKEPTFSFGKADGNTYKNEFLGLSCTLPEDWTFYSDQQILEMNNLTSEYYDEDTANLIEDAAIIYDMVAVRTDNSTISVTLEKLNAAQLLSLDIKAVVESQFDAVVSTYENMGYTDIQLVYDQVTVDGKQYDAMILTASIQGVHFYSTSFVYRKGSYLASVAVSSVLEDNTPAYLSYLTVE